jgi:hypothetical protein
MVDVAMNELELRAAEAALANVPSSQIKAAYVQQSAQVSRFKQLAKKAKEKAAEGVMELAKTGSAVAAAGAMGYIEGIRPEWEYLDENQNIPTMAAVGGAALVGSMFIGGSAGELVRAGGTGLLAAAAYKFGNDRGVASLEETAGG